MLLLWVCHYSGRFVCVEKLSLHMPPLHSFIQSHFNPKNLNPPPSGAKAELGTMMKSVGEVMAIGRTWVESFQKALRGLETGLDGWDLPKNYKKLSKEDVSRVCWGMVRERWSTLFLISSLTSTKPCSRGIISRCSDGELTVCAALS